MGNQDSTGSEDQINSSGLCFYSRDDAFNYADELVQDSNSWLAAHSLDFANRYELLNLEVDVACRSVRDARDYHLVFRAVPTRGEAKLDNGIEMSVTNVPAASIESGWNDDFVFLGITKLVQSPKKIIPSFVWLKRNHQIKDFWGNVFGACVYSTLNLSQVTPKREVGAPPSCSSSDGDGKASLVEGGTKGTHNIKCDSGQTYWHGFNELDLMHILRGVSVHFNDTGVWMRFEEDANLPLKFTKAALGVLDAVL
jgi:hypothetical protein